MNAGGAIVAASNVRIPRLILCDYDEFPDVAGEYRRIVQRFQLVPTFLLVLDVQNQHLEDMTT